MRRLLWALGAVSLLVGAGCGQAPEALEQTRGAVLNGEPSGPEDNAVVKIASLQSEGGIIHYCSGTLIAPNLVITARHCVFNSNDLPFSCTNEGELVPSSQGGRMGKAVPAEDIDIHVGPEFKTPVAAVGAEIFSTDTNTMCRNDIALLLLDRELTDVPISTLRLGAGVKRGETLSVVGYGLNEEARGGVRHRRDGVKVTGVGESEYNSNPDQTPPRTFVTPGALLCIGDSGGPAFGSRGELVGVWSQVVGDCENPSSQDVFTDVAPFEDGVIKPAFAASGYEPIVAELPTDEGGAGAGNTDDGGAPPDVGGTDAGGSAGSGGAGGDDPEPAAGSAGTGGSKTTPRKKRDSGCSTAPQSSGLGAPLALLGTLLVASVARRRRRR